MKRWIAGFALVIAAAIVLPRLPAFRDFWAGVINEDLEGATAPSLTSTAWVGGEPAKRDWRLLAFFLPH
ncbi:MAG: hypothetical protein ACYTHK_06840 [Planctomycetota bacterium]